MKRYPAALLIVAAMAAGCGDNGPTLVTVSGRLTLDGVPLPFKNVRFIPEPGTPGAGAGANTTEDGSYTLLAVRPGAVKDVQGVPPGSYRVVVSEPIFPIDAPKPESPDGTPAPAIGPPVPSRPRRLAIPSPYTKAETTPLLVEVPPEGGVLNLPLSSQQP